MPRRSKPSSGSHATRILGSYQPGEKITLRIMREHRALDVEATQPEGPPQQRDLMREVIPDGEPQLPGPKVVIVGNDTA